MPTEISIPTPPEFDFLTTVRSHGWYDLAPFYFDEPAGELRLGEAEAGAGAPDQAAPLGAVEGFRRHVEVVRVHRPLPWIMVLCRPRRA